jgi:hypothetical protein
MQKIQSYQDYEDTQDFETFREECLKYCQDNYIFSGNVTMEQFYKKYDKIKNAKNIRILKVLYMEMQDN